MHIPVTLLQAAKSVFFVLRTEHPCTKYTGTSHGSGTYLVTTSSYFDSNQVNMYAWSWISIFGSKFGLLNLSLNLPGNVEDV
jgi:hypothetical protein